MSSHAKVKKSYKKKNGVCVQVTKDQRLKRILKVRATECSLESHRAVGCGSLYGYSQWRFPHLGQKWSFIAIVLSVMGASFFKGLQPGFWKCIKTCEIPAGPSFVLSYCLGPNNMIQFLLMANFLLCPQSSTWSSAFHVRGFEIQLSFTISGLIRLRNISPLVT